MPFLRGASAAGPIAVIVPIHATAAAGGDDHLELLTEIWHDAWLLDYVPFESGMVIVPVDGGEWFVLVSDAGAQENPFVDQGFFIENGPSEYVAAMNWNDDLLDEAGLLGVQHTFVSGILFGSTGWEGQIDAMITEVIAPGENPGDDPVVVQILTPVGLDEPDIVPPSLPRAFDLAGAAQEAAAQDHRIRFTPGDDDLTPDCGAIWDLCREACWDEFIGDTTASGFIAVGCVAACLILCSASTFAYGICVAICSAGCLAIEAGCLAKAKGTLDACHTRCDMARMTCEPGWVSPAVK